MINMLVEDLQETLLFWRFVNWKKSKTNICIMQNKYIRLYWNYTVLAMNVQFQAFAFKASQNLCYIYYYELKLITTLLFTMVKTKFVCDEEWEEITKELNPLGIQKSAAKWRKYWRVLKMDTKTKLGNIHEFNAMSASKGDSKFRVLSNMEAKIMKVIAKEPKQRERNSTVVHEELFVDNGEFFVDVEADAMGDRTEEEPHFTKYTYAPSKLKRLNANYMNSSTATATSSANEHAKHKSNPFNYDPYMEYEKRKVQALESLVQLKREEVRMERSINKNVSELLELFKQNYTVKNNN